MPTLFYITEEQISQYEATSPAFRAIYAEIQELSKKKPEASLNVAKITLVNRILRDLKILLKTSPGSKYLDLLDEEQVPQYSDVVLVLSQFAAVLDKFYERHYGYFYGTHQWVTREAEAAATAKK